MKQFLLFSGEVFYATGGWCDFRGSFDTVEEAKAAHAEWYLKEMGEPFDPPEKAYGWYHIVDGREGTVVDRYRGAYGSVYEWGE